MRANNLSTLLKRTGVLGALLIAAVFGTACTTPPSQDLTRAQAQDIAEPGIDTRTLGEKTIGERKRIN